MAIDLPGGPWQFEQTTPQLVSQEAVLPSAV